MVFNDYLIEPTKINAKSWTAITTFYHYHWDCELGVRHLYDSSLKPFVNLLVYQTRLSKRQAPWSGKYRGLVFQDNAHLDFGCLQVKRLVVVYHFAYFVFGKHSCLLVDIKFIFILYNVDVH